MAGASFLMGRRSKRQARMESRELVLATLSQPAEVGHTERSRTLLRCPRRSNSFFSQTKVFSNCTRNALSTGFDARSKSSFVVRMVVEEKTHFALFTGNEKVFVSKVSVNR